MKFTVNVTQPRQLTRRNTEPCRVDNNRQSTICNPQSLQLPRLGEGLEAAIVGLLGFRREAAAGKLPAGKVILNTLAAQALPLAGGVRAATVRQVLFLVALHGRFLVSLGYSKIRLIVRCQYLAYRALKHCKSRSSKDLCKL